MNHERISVPGVRALSEQPLSSVKCYESAWRTANTGSTPAMCRRPAGGTSPPLSAHGAMTTSRTAGGGGEWARSRW